MKKSKLMKVFLFSASVLILGISCKHGHGGGGGEGPVYTPAPSGSGGSSGSSSGSGGETIALTPAVQVPAIGTPPPGFVAVAGRAGGDGDIVPMFACEHEVTQGEYETYCSYSSLQPQDRYGWGKGSNYPAYYICWYDALVYCNLRSIDEGLTPCYSSGGETNPANWYGMQVIGGKYYVEASLGTRWNIACNVGANGYRLPTVAEWAYLAKGGFVQQPYIYPGSSIIDDVAWYNGNSQPTGALVTTHPVMTKAANSLGLYDMSGNVEEWCWDKTAFGTTRKLCGGSYSSYPECCTVDGHLGLGCSNEVAPSTRHWSHGFRVVRTAQ